MAVQDGKLSAIFTKTPNYLTKAETKVYFNMNKQLKNQVNSYLQKIEKHKQVIAKI
jgi:hypothetical protein